MIMEYELNRKYIVDDEGEAIGETNFVVSASWLMTNLEIIALMYVLTPSRILKISLIGMSQR